MTQKNLSPSNLTLSEVKKKFELWRKTRENRKPIPRELWDTAANLSETHSINQISKALHLNYTALKNRVNKKEANQTCIQKVQASSFVELNFEQSPLASECIVEMQDCSGAKMRMCFKGKTDFDFLELGKAFWRKGV